jgi:hypothetical protein
VLSTKIGDKSKQFGDGKVTGGLQSSNIHISNPQSPVNNVCVHIADAVNVREQNSFELQILTTRQRG